MIEEEQSKNLESAAERLAEYVENTGRKVRILGATPPVRKIMHTALNERESVENISHGFGIFRHLMIQPAREKTEDAAPPEPATETNEQEEA